MKKGRSLKRIIIVLLVAGIAIQFIRPSLDNPPVTGDMQAPAEVKAILQRACYDCHSNQTKLAWFDQPAPAYWLVVDDVKKARKVLNFSEWDSLPKGQRAAKLFESLNQMEYHTMPLKQYAFLHHDAALSSSDIDVLKNYLRTLTYKAVVPDTARQRASWEQYALWITTARPIAATEVKDGLNGIPYSAVAGFRNWTPISSSERYDNGTLRVILGNEVTVRAIREGHTNPWPDSTMFAKVAWDQSVDSAGEIHAGAYKQVEFMIRDRSKYASTGGWGWVRWVGGLAMKPYGAAASFTMECVNCHKPMKFQDGTFTFPLADTLALEGPATFVHEDMVDHPLTGRLITSFINPKDSTMSILYGNEAAAASARSGQPYKPGTTLTLVTWSQREDLHWFGARIPKALVSVEQLIFTPAPAPAYDRYGGDPIAHVDRPSAEIMAARIKYISGLKASVIP